MTTTEEAQLAFQKLSNGDYNEAVTLYSKLLEDDKQNTEFLSCRAESYYKLSEFQKCLVDVKCLMTLDPANHLKTLILGGRAATELEKFEDAYYCYKAGLQIEPNHKEIIDDLKLLQKAIIRDVEKKGSECEEKGYKAVEFCRQDPYPGDIELYQMELDILEKKYKIKTQTFPLKRLDEETQQKAANAAMAGHNCMVAGKWKEAEKLFTVTLNLDPNNHIVRRLRAEVFYTNNELNKTLQDLWLIPKQKRMAEVWRLGGKIFREYDLLVLAEFWFRKASQLGKDEESKILFQRCRVKRLYSPLTTDFPIKVDFTEYGRSIYATEDIPAGEIVFTDGPIVFGEVFDTVHYKNTIPSCDNCAESLLTPQEYFKETFSSMESDLREMVLQYWSNSKPITCHKCKKVRYCSGKCRSEAWHAYHEIICPAKSKATARLYTISQNLGKERDEHGKMVDVWDGHFSPMILARIWATIASTAKRLAQQNNQKVPTTEQWALAKSPYRKFIAYGNVSIKKEMKIIKQLMREIFSDCGDGISYEITDAEFEGRYYQAVCNMQVFSSPWTPYHEFLQKLGSIETEDDRTIRLIKYLKEKPPSTNVCGMFPLHACLNHSCMNNVEVSDGLVHDRAGVSVRAKTDIKAGDEIFTTYIDTAMPRKLRRAWLYKSFNFWCKCPRCQVEGDDPDVCTTCGKKAAEGKKFPGCGKCMKAWYCSVKCQKQAWRHGHKIVCTTEHSKTSYS